LCSSGLPSDVIIEVGEISFHLHKFPLLSRSRTLENLIGDSSEDEKKSQDDKRYVLKLHDLPGGANAFLLAAKFCYGVKIELTAMNVVSLRCTAEYLQMTEDYGEGNFIMQTEVFLNEVLGNWVDTIKALETCEEVLSHAEEHHIVSRCINSLAVKACADPTLFSWPATGHSATQSPSCNVIWNGLRTASKQQPLSEDWWYEGVSSLKLPMYKRFILAISSRGMKPERIAGTLVFYAKKYLPLMGRQSSFQNGNRAALGSIHTSARSDADQMSLLEVIVELLPDQKGVIPTKLLFRLLRISMILHASPVCRENLEKRVGAQLDQALLEDLLIPNMGHSAETLYEIDCVQRILDYFMLVDTDATHSTSNCLSDEAQLIESSHSLTPRSMVANLVDGYLAEVAPDVNLKLPKFQSLAAVVSDYARPLDDGIYRAIDIYLKAHPWLTDSEREQLCRLMNCQKLSLEASTHAAQNERLPLRVIAQVLFFEQLRLRTSVAGWFFVSDTLDNSQNPSGTLALPRNECGIQDKQIVCVDIMRERVSELEKQYESMKHEMEKLTKTKGSWYDLYKMLGLKLKLKSCMPKDSKKLCTPKVFSPPKTPLSNGKQNQDSGQLVD
ncbi:hypothetical protein RJ639_006309, partial [Escallonia herrerae]